MENLDKAQQFQENQYVFPYHYIPTWDGKNFSQCRSLKQGLEYLAYLQFIAELALRSNPHALLDIGCGDGKFLVDIHNKFPEKHLTGIDYSEQAIQFAKLMGPGINWLAGNVADDSLFDTHFKVATLIETLEHIPIEGIPDFLQGIANRLDVGGELILSVPHKNVPLIKKHFQHFDKDSLAQYVLPLFEINEYHFINSYSPFVQKVIKPLLINKYFILNRRRWLRKIFNFYCKRFLVVEEDSCMRIVLVCKKK